MKTLNAGPPPGTVGVWHSSIYRGHINQTSDGSARAHYANDRRTISSTTKPRARAHQLDLSCVKLFRARARPDRIPSITLHSLVTQRILVTPLLFQRISKRVCESGKERREGERVNWKVWSRDQARLLHFYRFSVYAWRTSFCCVLYYKVGITFIVYFKLILQQCKNQSWRTFSKTALFSWINLFVKGCYCKRILNKRTFLLCSCDSSLFVLFQKAFWNCRTYFHCEYSLPAFYAIFKNIFQIFLQTFLLGKVNVYSWIK